MATPTIGTYVLTALLAGVGGWTVGEALLDQDPAPAAAAAAPAAPVDVRIVLPGGGRHGGGAAAGRQAGGVAATGGAVAPAPTASTWTTGATARTAPATPTATALGSGQWRRPAPARTGRSVSQHRAATGSPHQQRPQRAPRSDVGQLLLAPTTQVIGSGNIIASHGAIVYVGEHGQLVANTGATSTSGVVALGVQGSTLGSGDSHAVAAPVPATVQVPAQGPAQLPAQLPARTPVPRSQAQPGGLVGVDPLTNHSFGLLGGGVAGSIAVSGFEDHSVSVLGDDQVTTYDDSNVFLGRDGQINANTGDTDSSGLNAVDVWDSTVLSGNSGDGEEAGDDEAEEAGTLVGSAEDGDEAPGTAAEDRLAQPARAGQTGPARTGGASVTDEGASTATGSASLVVGADGYDDVSIRAVGNRNITTYDDSNVVIGGRGGVNAQIGDSDTGGAVVMGIRGSHVQAGCEGDLCVSDGGR